MSRSRRKTPIFGIAGQQSESADKALWHQRWRARERTAMAGKSADELLDYVPIHQNQVGQVWAMAKDGHKYWPLESQVALATQRSESKGRTALERSSLRQRMLRKWMSK